MPLFSSEAIGVMEDLSRMPFRSLKHTDVVKYLKEKGYIVLMGPPSVFCLTEKGYREYQLARKP